MTLAYIDTSILLALAFREPGSRELQERLTTFRTVSSNLLEAEFRAGLAREQMEFSPEFLDGLAWILPERPLTKEIELVLAKGYLRGADLWHLATALHASQAPEESMFLTRDRRQRNVADALGFRVSDGSSSTW